MAKIFISYAHEDIKAALQLYAELSAISGVSPWLDKESLPVGMRWEPAIRKAIRESDFFLALLSKHSMPRRRYAIAEMKMALKILEEFREDQVFLIPIRLEDCPLPFEEFWGINYVDFFPSWDEGFQRLLKAISPALQDAADLESPAAQIYEYSCALVDLDAGLTNLPQLCRRLNSIQHFFHFGAAPITPPRGGFSYEYQSLLVSATPKTFYEQRRFLSADLVVCLTQSPLAFGEGDDMLYNCFSGPSPADETIMFVSTDMLHDFTERSGQTFEKEIVYIVLSQLVGYFTNMGYHEETRACLMDFCGFRTDMVEGLRRMRICDQCLLEIKNRRLSRAVEAILADEMVVED
jgi:TIR domain